MLVATTQKQKSKRERRKGEKEKIGKKDITVIPLVSAPGAY